MRFLVVFIVLMSQGVSAQRHYEFKDYKSENERRWVDSIYKDRKSTRLNSSHT